MNYKSDSLIDKIFSRDGMLAGYVPGYEFRAEQGQMATFVSARLADTENGMIEAGTGTGKTLAYLIPAVLYALETGKKIAISTETKALQKQLMDKDLPLVRDFFLNTMKDKFSYALCLGSANYACRRRFEIAVQKGKFEQEELKSLRPLAKLFEAERLFTRFDLRISNRLWTQVNREPEICGGYRCPYSGDCPYQKAKKQWAAADILVMNHYLFFTNIASAKTYLPRSDAVIFDEAHSIEDIASSQLGFFLSNRLLADAVDRFYRKHRKNNLINNISGEKTRVRAVEAAGKIIAEGSKFFAKAAALVPNAANQLRLRRPLQFGAELLAPLSEFVDILRKTEDDFQDEYMRMEYDMGMSRIGGFLEGLGIFTEMEKEDYVYWLESAPDGLLTDCTLRAQPVAIAEKMRNEVFHSYESSLLVSATLAVDKNFTFIGSRLGIDRNQDIALPSPFDYMRQAVLYIGKDIPEPNVPGFAKQAAMASADIIRSLNGNCLLLFTSYRMLEDVRRELGGMVDHRIYSQGDMTPGEAVEAYLSDDNSVLMGTHSFWQGIDLPGDLVRGVIMMRLPFAVPDSPPVQAKMEQIAAKGLNSFAHFQIPEAVIKFKQGFGRLIRSSTDVGIVAVLDSRLYSKPYGKRFIGSLPKCRVVYRHEDAVALYGTMKREIVMK